MRRAWCWRRCRSPTARHRRMGGRCRRVAADAGHRAVRPVPRPGPRRDRSAPAAARSRCSGVSTAQPQQAFQALRHQRRSGHADADPGHAGRSSGSAEGLTHNEAGIAGQRRGRACRADRQAGARSSRSSIPARLWGERLGRGRYRRAHLRLGDRPGARSGAAARRRRGRRPRRSALRLLSPVPVAALGARARWREARGRHRAEPRRAALSLSARRRRRFRRTPRASRGPGPLPFRPAEIAAHLCLRTVADERIMTDTPPTPHCVRRTRAAKDFMLRRASDLVPGLRRLSACWPRWSGAREARPPAARGRAGVRHRLLVAAAGLHDLLRLSRRARPRARRGRTGAEVGAARSRGHRGRRRRRRLFDRRQPFHPCLPAQRRHALHRDGQPRLRHDQGPAVADHRARLGHRASRPAASGCARSIRWRSRSPPAPISSRAASPAIRTALPS